MELAVFDERKEAVMPTANDAVDVIGADAPPCPAKGYQEPCPTPFSCSDGCKRLGFASLNGADVSAAPCQVAVATV